MDVSFVLAAVLARSDDPGSIEVILLAEEQTGEPANIHNFAFGTISLVTRA